MNKTQLVSLEITTACNLGERHHKCPNRSPERYRSVNTSRPLTDELITDTVVRLHRDFGFRGLVGWHYYCEPLEEEKRCIWLMAAIRQQIPEARFLLWTNGTLLHTPLTTYDVFDGIVVTDYGHCHRRLMKQLEVAHKQAVIVNWPLDGRLNIEGVETNVPCTRPFCEMPIDYYGNIHACCYDWRGRVPLGNLWSQPLESIVSRWQSFRDKLLGPLMSRDAPQVCRTCRPPGRPRPRRSAPTVTRILPGCVFAPDAAEAAEVYVRQKREERKSCRPERIAVVFVSYLKVPESRLREHFRWNGPMYEKLKARVYVVTEREHQLPSYAECVIFPESELPRRQGRRVFSLCKTKNAGIRKALADGAEVIVCMDVDTLVPAHAWDYLLSVTNDDAKVPMVALVPKTLKRVGAKLDKQMTNTVAMTSRNWHRVQYHEGCVGYGADDGIIHTTIAKHGLMIDRGCEVWHIDHPDEDGAVNVPGRGRGACYGRADGFNPDNFPANKRIHLAMLRRKGK